MFLFATFVNAQACGYTFLTIYLTDFQGNTIKNAKIRTFEESFKTEDFLHYPRNNQENYDSLTNSIAWEEKKQAYFGSEGMCGGHRSVGLRISTEGFKEFEKVIDLPLGWTTYSVKLARINSKDIAEAIQLTHFSGKIIDINNGVITSANLEILAESGKKYFTKSDSDGWFEIDLPLGKYTARVSQNGFKTLKLINFNIEKTQRIYLDLKLKVRGCDDCNGDILGENNGEDRKEEVLDYQKIKEK